MFIICLGSFVKSLNVNMVWSVIIIRGISWYWKVVFKIWSGM